MVEVPPPEPVRLDAHNVHLAWAIALVSAQTNCRVATAEILLARRAALIGRDLPELARAVVYGRVRFGVQPVVCDSLLFGPQLPELSLHLAPAILAEHRSRATSRSTLRGNPAHSGIIAT